ncbi:MAG: VWA domain-containing protein [Ligilactobacillus animalis]|uniref:SpaA isopeptide-forming pilin-related protein n=1 Tax=Ligilactobacillus animalis TaxID=1605 RepID=UPI00242B628D|nr:SpaA isopeptide-forming pilin-related protein [Ligilactobacillus animalis]MCI5942754.1 VWA domain-containing protein [Ligilactobacillus animalis]
MKTKLVRKVCALLLIIGLLFPLLGQSVQAYGDDIEPVYTNDDTGTYPAASWKPTGQENVINHQGGTVSGWDNNTNWSGDPSDTTNSYIKHGNANDPDFAIRKFARETTTPGTFDVFLNVRGNSVRQEKTVDVVFVVDTSGSMANDSRLASAKTGIRSFIEDVEAAGLGNNVRAGLVSYSGESHVQVALNTVSNNGASLKSKVSALRADGGTFTQAGLHDAYEMLKNSNSDEKQIILLTDGEPTYSYRVTSAIKDGQTVYGTNFDYGIKEGAGNSERLPRPYNVNNLRIGATWPATLGEARLIKNNSNISIRALGINITGDGQSYNMKLLASEGHYKGVSSYKEIQGYLNDQTKDIISSFATVQKGKVTIPLGKQYEYVGKDATLSVGTEKVDTSTITEEFDVSTSMLTWSGLELGKDQEVQLHYQVRLKTGTADFVPNKWYPMSGETVLTAEEIPGARFGIPSGKAPGTTIDVTKEWKTFSQTELPENISFKVIREVAGDDEWQTAGGVLTAGDKWQKTFDKLTLADGQEVALAKYNKLGVDYNYQVSEETAVEGFNTKIEHLGENKWRIINTELGLQVEKRASQSDAKLDGAEFKLVKYSDEFVTEDPSFNEKLVANSKDIMSGLKNGHYALIETKAPTGYQAEPNALKFSIKDGKFFDEANNEITATNSEAVRDGFYLNLSNDSAYILTGVKYNTLKPFELNLTKTDTKGKQLSGAEFELVNAKGEQIKFEYANDAKTKLKFSGLTPGEYTLTETKAPADHKLLTAPLKFTITEAGKVEFENEPKDVKVELTTGDDQNTLDFRVENTPLKTGSVSVAKYATNGQPLADAKFKLIRYTDAWQIQDESFEKTITANSENVLDDLKSGHYGLQEISAPAGYQLDESVIKFKWEDEKWFDENGKEITAAKTEKLDQLYLDQTNAEKLIISRANRLKDTDLTIKKVNALTQKTLAGAEFELTDETGQRYDITTTEDGIFTVTNLRPGAYVLKEVKAPAGYVKLSDEIEFTITEDGKLNGKGKIELTTTGHNLIELKVNNFPAGILPETGGPGVWLYVLIGSILAGLAFVARRFVIKKRGV